MAAASAWSCPLDADLDVLAQICLHLSDRTALFRLPCVSAALRSALHHQQFLSARLRLKSRSLSLRARKLLDMSAIPRSPKHVAALEQYFAQSCDISRGSEPCLISINTRILLGAHGQFLPPETHLLQEGSTYLQCTMPRDIVSGEFLYEAGPWPAAYPLQVVRSGMLIRPGMWPDEGAHGLGYGVRTLVPIARGSYICSYWGVRRADPPQTLARQLTLAHAACIAECDR